ncbi:MAG: hypothetical protein ABJB05_09850 [Parafilimonas sp.]
MNNSDKNSSEKENKKVQTDKQFKDNEVHEGKAENRISDKPNDESAYPLKNEKDNQYKTQPEYIDRNAESKDKS